MLLFKVTNYDNKNIICKNYFFSLLIKRRLKIIVAHSVIGPTSQTPVMPRRGGRVKIAINKITRPLADEMIADSFAFPHDVK